MDAAWVNVNTRVLAGSSLLLQAEPVSQALLWNTIAPTFNELRRLSTVLRPGIQEVNGKLPLHIAQLLGHLLGSQQLGCTTVHHMINAITAATYFLARAFDDPEAGKLPESISVSLAVQCAQSGLLPQLRKAMQEAASSIREIQPAAAAPAAAEEFTASTSNTRDQCECFEQAGGPDPETMLPESSRHHTLAVPAAATALDSEPEELSSAPAMVQYSAALLHLFIKLCQLLPGPCGLFDTKLAKPTAAPAAKLALALLNWASQQDLQQAQAPQQEQLPGILVSRAVVVLQLVTGQLQAASVWEHTAKWSLQDLVVTGEYDGDEISDLQLEEDGPFLMQLIMLEVSMHLQRLKEQKRVKRQQAASVVDAGSATATAATATATAAADAPAADSFASGGGEGSSSVAGNGGNNSNRSGIKEQLVQLYKQQLLQSLGISQQAWLAACHMVQFNSSKNCRSLLTVLSELSAGFAKYCNWASQQPCAPTDVEPGAAAAGVGSEIASGTAVSLVREDARELLQRQLLLLPLAYLDEVYSLSGFGRLHALAAEVAYYAVGSFCALPGLLQQLETDAASAGTEGPAAAAAATTAAAAALAAAVAGFESACKNGERACSAGFEGDLPKSVLYQLLQLIVKQLSAARRSILRKLPAPPPARSANDEVDTQLSVATAAASSSINSQSSTSLQQQQQQLDAAANVTDDEYEEELISWSGKVYDTHSQRVLPVLQSQTSLLGVMEALSRPTAYGGLNRAWAGMLGPVAAVVEACLREMSVQPLLGWADEVDWDCVVDCVKAGCSVKNDSGSTPGPWLLAAAAAEPGSTEQLQLFWLLLSCIKVLRDAVPSDWHYSVYIEKAVVYMCTCLITNISNSTSGSKGDNGRDAGFGSRRGMLSGSTCLHVGSTSNGPARACRTGCSTGSSHGPSNCTGAGSQRLLPAMVPWMVLLGRCLNNRAKYLQNSITVGSLHGMRDQLKAAGYLLEKMAALLPKLDSSVEVEAEVGAGGTTGQSKAAVETTQREGEAAGAQAVPGAGGPSAACAAYDLQQCMQQLQQLLPVVQQGSVLARNACEKHLTEWFELEQQLQQQQQLDREGKGCGANAGSSSSSRNALPGSLDEDIRALRAAVDAAANAQQAAAAFSASFIALVPQQLLELGAHICKQLPTWHCCNNPDCTNMGKASEGLLVAGKSCICGRCMTARYCSRKCQLKHYKEHKQVCRALHKQQQVTATVGVDA